MLFLKKQKPVRLLKIEAALQEKESAPGHSQAKQAKLKKISRFLIFQTA